MRPMPILGAQVYISEGRNPRLISSLKEVARSVPGVVHLQSFVDEPYHRTSFTLASRITDLNQLQKAVLTLTEAALSMIDMRQHDAQHPRLGCADHVSIHPFSLCPTMDETETCGRFARSLAAAVGGNLDLPTYTYGWASEHRRALDDIRRQFGYFRGSEWKGPTFLQGAERIEPDFGPSAPDPTRGVMCVGALPWITNFNVQLATEDLALGRRVARAISQRQPTGISGVQSMALLHANGQVEVACNVLDPAVDPQAVEERIGREAGLAGGVPVRGSYVIGMPFRELLAKAEKELAESDKL